MDLGTDAATGDRMAPTTYDVFRTVGRGRLLVFVVEVFNDKDVLITDE
ncbi:hypothetical protein ALMP_74900 [Streptomyces sp. A012304]|nr:hypothetical protein ALMP_74900 [Streptomyces sp. A012304]